jgi:hypothetical protein
VKHREHYLELLLAGAIFVFAAAALGHRVRTASCFGFDTFGFDESSEQLACPCL